MHFITCRLNFIGRLNINKHSKHINTPHLLIQILTCILHLHTQIRMSFIIQVDMDHPGRELGKFAVLIELVAKKTESFLCHCLVKAQWILIVSKRNGNRHCMEVKAIVYHLQGFFIVKAHQAVILWPPTINLISLDQTDLITGIVLIWRSVAQGDEHPSEGWASSRRIDIPQEDEHPSGGHAPFRRAPFAPYSAKYLVSSFKNNKKRILDKKNV